MLDFRSIFKNSWGFTLVEILVAVGILSTLLGATIAYINPAKQINRVKDTKRSQDLALVEKSVDLYYNDHGCYPTSVPFGQQWTNSATNTGTGSNTVYMRLVPQDSKYPYEYLYQPSAAGSSIQCPQWYTLFARLEAPSDTATTCSLDVNAGSNCVPANYGSSGYYYTCKAPSNANCRANAIVANPGSSTALMCYPDTDGDGYAPRNALGVEQPTGIRACSTGSTKRQPLTTGDPPQYDCDDTSNSIKTPTKYCRDHDGDRYCDSLNSSYFCPGDTTIPSDYITQSNSRGTDCDDTLADRNVLINEYRISPPVCDAASPTKTACIPPNSPETGYSLNPSGSNLVCTPDQNTGTFALSCVVAGSTCTSINQFNSCVKDMCPAGFVAAGNKCTDVSLDNNNCGTCGTVCGTGRTCTSGNCTCNAGSLYTYCSSAGTCVDLHTDRNNCGTCGTVCTALQDCNNGTCTQFPLNGLIAYFNMDDTTPAVSSSVGNITVTSTSYPIRSTTAKPGLGASRDFNGTSNYVQFSGPLSLGDFTLSVWVNMRAISDSGYSYLIESTTGWGNLYTTPGGWYPYYAETPTGQFSFNAWHHLLLLHPSDDRIKAYVDGQLKWNCVNGYRCDINPSTTWFMGKYPGGGYFYNGLMDEVGIWNRLLTDSEIAKLYSGGAGVALPTSSACYNNNFKSDVNNCGSCGNVCTPGQICDNGTCTGPRKRVFVTSQTFNGNLGGLAGADLKCQTLANNAGLPGTYKAWLSSSTVNAKDRLSHSTIPYKTPAGDLVANNWTELTNGSLLQHSINTTESGSTPTGGDYPISNVVWTNTTWNGAGAAGNTCSDWTVAGGLPVIGGRFSSSDGAWTYIAAYASNGITYCAYSFHLYCFEQ